MLKRVSNLLEQRKEEFRVIETQADELQTRTDIQNVLEQVKQVIVLGGDGTLHLMANLLAYQKIPLGILPCGTGNDFCKNIYKDKGDPLSIALDGEVIDIDLGSCNGTYFMNVLGIGYDGMIAKQTSGAKHGLFRSMVYLWNAIKYLPLYKEKPMELSAKEITKNEATFLVAFANGAFFANGMKVAPYADISDGKLDCCWIGKMPMLRKIYCLLKIFTGNHIHSEKIEYISGETFNISTPGLPVEADGEYLGMTPVKVQVEKKALQLKIPVQSR